MQFAEVTREKKPDPENENNVSYEKKATNAPETCLKEQRYIDSGYPSDVANCIKSFLTLDLINYAENHRPDLGLNESKSLGQFTLSFGLEICGWLLKIDLLKGVSVHESPHPCFVPGHTVELSVAASRSKPQITTVPLPTMYTSEEDGNFDVYITLDKKTIPDTGSVHIKREPGSDASVGHCPSVPFVINKQTLQGSLRYFGYILTSSLEDNGSDIAHFCRIFYDIDFSSLSKNDTDDTLVHGLSRYSTSLTVCFDFSLSGRIRDNFACTRAYDKISSTKCYLKGLINDAPIF